MIYKNSKRKPKYRYKKLVSSTEMRRLMVKSQTTRHFCQEKAFQNSFLTLHLFLRLVAVILLLICMVSAWIPLPQELEKRKGQKKAHFDSHCPGEEPSTQYESIRFLPIALDEMGTWLPEMVVALEDHRFHHHNGVDLITLCGSILRFIRSGRSVSGASTITQQLIKLADGKFEDRTIQRKLYEIFAAMRLERQWTKKKILEEYLNRLPFGNGIFGAEAASVCYFGKCTADLDQREAIFLAGLPQAPSRYNPWRYPEKAIQRYHRSIDRLEELGVLTRELANQYYYDIPAVKIKTVDWIRYRTLQSRFLSTTQENSTVSVLE